MQQIADASGAGAEGSPRLRPGGFVPHAFWRPVPPAAMNRSAKPVRKCHACPLNLGRTCWAFAVPREQWRRHAVCPGLHDTALHQLHRDAQKQASVLTGKDLRRQRVGRRRLGAMPGHEGVPVTAWASAARGV